MKQQIAALGLLAALSASAVHAGTERRCGWISNPTPANWWLNDREAEWIISEQGGYQAKGVDLPDFTGKQWVITNAGDHGYGCACLTATFDHRTKHVLRIAAVKQLPLRQCKADKGLKPVE